MREKRFCRDILPHYPKDVGVLQVFVGQVRWVTRQKKINADKNKAVVANKLRARPG